MMNFPRNKRGQLAVIAIVAFVVLAAAVFFIFKPSQISSATGNAAGNQSQSEKIINIDAQRFQYTPGTITVKKGDKVKIIVNNVDFSHGIAIPDLGVSGIDSVEFTADKVGTFQFRCPTICGSGHRTMTGTLIVQ